MSVGCQLLFHLAGGEGNCPIADTEIYIVRVCVCAYYCLCVCGLYVCVCMCGVLVCVDVCAYACMHIYTHVYVYFCVLYVLVCDVYNLSETHIVFQAA